MGTETVTSLHVLIPSALHDGVDRIARDAEMERQQFGAAMNLEEQTNGADVTVGEFLFWGKRISFQG